MTFSSEIQNSASQRNTFVRIEGTQIIDSGDLTDIGGNKYDFVVDHIPTSVSVYETALDPTVYAEDATLSTTQTWNFTESSMTLHIHTEYTLETTDKVLSDFMLTYTDAQDVEDTIDLIDGGDAVIWSDRLKSTPKITDTIKNSTDGVMSVAASNISLENSDLALNSLFGHNKIYNGREVKIWVRVNGQTSALFRGEVTTIDVTSTTVVFGVVEQSIQFDKPSYFSAKGTAIYGESGVVVNKHKGLPIPIIVGSSPYEVASGLITGSIYSSETMDYRAMPTAVCRAPTYASGVPSTSNNRTWTMNRSLPSDSLSTRTTGTGTVTLDSKGSTLTYNGVAIGAIDINATGGYTCREGDVIIAEDTAYLNVEVAFVVVKLFTDTLYRVAILPINGGIPGSGLVGPLGSGRFVMETTTRSHSGILLQEDTGNKYIMVEGMDFNLSTSTDTGGLTRNNAVFINNFEGSLYKNQGVGMKTLNPYRDEFRFYRNAGGVEHSTMLKDLLEADGYTVDSDSITTAAADDVSGVCIMSIPSSNAEEFDSLRDVLSEIIGSTFGYIRLDTSGSIFYGLFRTPTTPTETRDDDSVLGATVIPRLSYYDIASQYIIKNRSLGSGYKERGSSNSNLPLNTSSDLAQAVYRSDKIKNFKTVFKTASGDYLTQLEELFGVPRVTYKYASDALDLDLTVGSVVTLNTSHLLGTVSTVDLLITNIVRSTNSVSVTGLELTA